MSTREEIARILTNMTWATCGGEFIEERPICGHLLCTLERAGDEIDRLRAELAHLALSNNSWSDRAQLAEERAEKAESELAQIKRTDMHRDDVQGATGDTT